MFSDKIFQFVKGYVILYTEGCSAERFLNLILRAGVRVLRIEKKEERQLLLTIPLSDFRNIRSAARHSGTRVHILKKCGLPMILHGVRARRCFFCGGVLFLLGTVLCTQFLWTVEIRGIPEDMAEEIRAAAEYAGIRPGAWIPSLPSGNDRKDAILSQTNRITWAWVYLLGTKAVVEVRPVTLPPSVCDPNEGCNVIAARDGMLSRMVVKNGRRVVEDGTPVLAGDILISGEADEMHPHSKHAVGEVYAKTWHRASGRFRRFQESTQLTGRKQSYYSLMLFSREIPMYFRKQIPFEAYRLEEATREFRLGKKHYLGLGIRKQSYLERQNIREPLSDEAVCARAQTELEEQIAKNLLPGAVREGETLSVREIDADFLEITLEMQFTEQIGLEQKLEEE